MPRFDDTAALAENWRTVLAADAALGVIALLGGIFVLLFIHVLAGAAGCLLGVAYLALIFQRAKKWKRLRDEAGLPPS